MVNASPTAFASFTDRFNPLRGIHAFKVGFDFEAILADNSRGYTGNDFNADDPTNPNLGHRIFRTDPGNGSAQIIREFAQPWTPRCPHKDVGDGVCHFNVFRGVTQARNFSVYARDAWNIGWAPGLVLNAGVRWEGQEMYGMDLMSDPLHPSV